MHPGSICVFEGPQVPTSPPSEVSHSSLILWLAAVFPSPGEDVGLTVPCCQSR